MKKSIFTLSALTIAVALTAGFTACSNDDILMEEEQQTNGKVHTYSVSIPANFGEEGTRAVELGTGDKEGYLVSTFKTTDIISVFNKSKTKEKSSVNLAPATDGKSVELTGDLTFTTAPEVGDVLLLGYNSNDKYFYYYTQKGSLAGLSDFDFATAEVTITNITGGTITTSPANFVNAQSMFKFTFTGLPDGVGVNMVTIWSTKKNLYTSINYTSAYQTPSNDLCIQLDNNARTANGQGVVYASLNFKPLSAGVTEDITFVVRGTNGKYYLGVKPSPAGGFQNSKYYTSTIALQPAVAPTLERYDGGPTSEFTPTDNMFRFFAHYDTFTSHNISISGDSYGYKFTMWDPIDGDEVGHSIVTLKGNGTATCLTTDNFLTCFMNMTFVLDGDYTINCPYNSTAIQISGGGSLKLSGNGTLTVTVNSATTTGFSATNYNGTQDASVLAADGYTVTRSARTTNADGSYTWTYTVRPVSFSVSSTQKVYFAPGNLQATWDGTSWSWGFAANQWDYIGNAAGNTSINGNGSVSEAGIVDLFGWSTNATYFGINRSTNNNDYCGDFAEWGSNVIGTYAANTWRTLTKDEWVYIFNTRESGSTVNGTSNARYTHATINTDGTGVNGIILFPDGITVANDEATSWGNINSISNWAAATKCTSAQWTALASKGCVFLPAAGWRSEVTVNYVGSQGIYWSSSPQVENKSYCVAFSANDLKLQSVSNCSSGRSVRLVRDL